MMHAHPHQCHNLWASSSPLSIVISSGSPRPLSYYSGRTKDIIPSPCITQVAPLVVFVVHSHPFTTMQCHATAALITPS
ncbi:hypothetical protein CGRA01v4_09218 [Colletotrichum graminicola]|nr:hypothetical protein CGRA01v4_09218 [Colletotrichum graminicola]